MKLPERINERAGPDAVAGAIAVKLAGGGLPSVAPETIFQGLGTGHPCAGCDRRIDIAEVETECLFPDGRGLRFHLDCWKEWHRQLG